MKYHHVKELRSARLEKDAAAYAVYIADNIAAGADRRESGEDVSGFDPRMPLASVFDTMSGKSEGFSPVEAFTADKTVFPEAKSALLASQERYSRLLGCFCDELNNTAISEEYVDSLLSLTENCLCFVPSSTSRDQRGDISLFDHVKLTAGLAACISEYLISRGETDWTRLMSDCDGFYKEKAFLLYTADLSGIQKFLYSVVSKGAKRSLKSRSLTLELLMENHIDELLGMCGLSRANLIYSGGGHCYILLPNTENARDCADRLTRATNRWFIDSFGTGLYLASAYVEASAGELMNKPLDKAPLKELFIALSRKLGDRKMHRYSADEIRLLNSDKGGHTRECRNCGRSSHLVHDKNGDICELCASFENAAREIDKPDMLMPVTADRPDGVCIELPSVNGSVFLGFMQEKELRKYLADEKPVVRIYSKNRAYIGMKYARNIYIGDYSYNGSSDLEALADEGEGIKRLAVLRADVDNLGAAFIQGFERKSGSPAERYRYDTLSRKAAFSRQMSVFFRCYINDLLKGGTDGLTLYERKNGDKRKKAAVVYAGGDDLFIVGAWADVLESAVMLSDAFGKYCGGALTLSAGVGIFNVKYPIIRSADETGELEDAAKDIEDGTKNAIALFEPERRFHWDILIDDIIGKKYQAICSLISMSPDGRRIGKAAIYKILDLLREADERINLARLAYQLARLAPNRDADGSFRKLTNAFYKWALDKENREQLITAIYIYVYLRRERGEKDGV